MYSHYLLNAKKLVELVYLQVYEFKLSFVRILGWVGGVWEILTLLEFKKPYEILDDPLVFCRAMIEISVLLFALYQGSNFLYPWQC